MCALPALQIANNQPPSDTAISPKQHEDSTGSRAKEATLLEEEWVRVLGHVDELKTHVKELEQQLQESSHEVGGNFCSCFWGGGKEGCRAPTGTKVEPCTGQRWVHGGTVLG